MAKSAFTLASKCNAKILINGITYTVSVPQIVPIRIITIRMMAKITRNHKVIWEEVASPILYTVPPKYTETNK